MDKKNIHAQLDEYILRNKMRHTIERKILLDQILALDSHFTAQSLHEMVNQEQHISLGCVYNNIDIFLAASIIVKHPFPGREAVFETAYRARNHHHRICTRCGAIKEFSDSKLSRTISLREFNAFTTEYHSLYLFGICKKCQPKKSKAKK